MNIYDFDGTIYNGDSCRDIVKYGLKKHPIITYRALKKARKLQKEQERGLVTFEKVKEEMLSFIFQIKNYPKFINDFVKSHMKNIKPFYKSRKTQYDVIVSASYELWLNVFARNLGIKYVIATRTDFDGHILGKNCKGIEKVNRLKQIFQDAPIACCYSDSASDIPLLELGSSAYVVEGNKLTPYKRGYNFKNKN